MRYLIEHSYDGSHYCGWQIQQNALTVQQVLEEKISRLVRYPVRLTGSSRTDTGVHAEQQFAHLDLEQSLVNPAQTVYQLNAMLPPDIAVRRLIPVAADFHSRFAATHRRYQYRISRCKNPFRFKRTYLFRTELAIDRMNEAAQLLLQYSDFESFSKIHTDVKTFLCTITEARWEQEGDLLVFTIQSNRFLRGMVRALVGTLLEVGSGKRSVADFEQLILAKDRKLAGPQAPAQGLFLTEVGYDADFSTSYGSVYKSE